MEQWNFLDTAGTTFWESDLEIFNKAEKVHPPNLIYMLLDSSLIENIICVYRATCTELFIASFYSNEMV